MEAVKEVAAVIGAIVGVLSALFTLYAKYLDLRKKRVQESEEEEVPLGRRTGGTEPVLSVLPVTLQPVAAAVAYEPEVPCARRIDAQDHERARTLVKAPALALIVTGVLGLAFNLVVAAYGFVDNFVTPLSTMSQPRQTPVGAMVKTASDREGGVSQRDGETRQDPANVEMTIIMLLSFSVACGMTIWAGFNMIRLKSYWVSIAGSLAAMPGACFCCLAGVPIGIWSLTVLLKPEVSSAFS